MTEQSFEVYQQDMERVGNVPESRLAFYLDYPADIGD
jgi:hypothetical protein